MYNARFIALGIITMWGSFAPVSAHANAADEVQILGTWAFETEPYRGGACAITGLAHLTPGQDDRTHECKLTVAEQCTNEARTMVLQSCTARRIGPILVIRSKILEKLEEGDADILYFADNFQLKIISGDEMTGQLKSASDATVHFTRDAGGIS